MSGTSRFNTQGDDASVVYSLPEEHAAIVQSDSTEVDLIGVECNAAGTIYLKYSRDTLFWPKEVIAGETVIGRIIGVGASTTLLDSEMTGLK